MPEDATLRALTGLPSKCEEYVRRVVGNFYASKLDLERAVVRIGVQGKGVTPHYKIEYPEVLEVLGVSLGEVSATRRIYNGANHEPMSAFDVGQIKPEHWSSVAMTFAEVQSLFGDLRARARRA